MAEVKWSGGSLSSGFYGHALLGLPARQRRGPGGEEAAELDLTIPPALPEFLNPKIHGMDHATLTAHETEVMAPRGDPFVARLVVGRHATSGPPRSSPSLPSHPATHGTGGEATCQTKIAE